MFISTNLVTERRFQVTNTILEQLLRTDVAVNDKLEIS